MLTQQLAASRSEDDGRISDMSFHDETLNNEDLSKIIFHNVQFSKCRFTRCDFSQSRFLSVAVKNCDFSNCNFSESFWKQVTIADSRGNGADFSQSCCKELTLYDSSVAYANSSKSRWENSAVSNCSFKESFWAEVRLKKLTLAASVFSGADFFKTPLKDLDFSDCKIDGITVSETFKELRGMQINLLQSADIARLLGIKIV